MYVDAHCHLYEFDLELIKEFQKSTIIVAVSDDIKSSYETLNLARVFNNVTPCVGVHPWEIGGSKKTDIYEIEKIISQTEVSCLGEIGLDKKFTPKTYNKQLKFFNEFLRLAREYGLSLNLHTAGASKEVFNLIDKYDIEKANFHWYTGPMDLLEKIMERNYTISINPAILIQKRHKSIAEKIHLNNLLTESDGPYRYRGLNLSPSLIPRLVSTLSKIKNIPLETILQAIIDNKQRIFG